jgi:hypothetical protein
MTDSKHELYVEDQYMMNGMLASCPCGWRSRVYRYREIHERFPDYKSVYKLPEEFIEVLKEEWNAHIKDD